MPPHFVFSKCFYIHVYVAPPVLGTPAGAEKALRMYKIIGATAARLVCCHHGRQGPAPRIRPLSGRNEALQLGKRSSRSLLSRSHFSFSPNLSGWIRSFAFNFLPLLPALAERGKGCFVLLISEIAVKRLIAGGPGSRPVRPLFFFSLLPDMPTFAFALSKAESSFSESPGGFLLARRLTLRLRVTPNLQRGRGFLLWEQNRRPPGIATVVLRRGANVKAVLRDTMRRLLAYRLLCFEATLFAQLVLCSISPR